MGKQSSGIELELELELILSQMAQKPMLRGEVESKARDPGRTSMCRVL